MSKNLFNSIQLKRPQSNVFDLTHDVKLSTKMGQLTPICVMECVPGDKFDISCESLIRFAPLVAPVMHRMDVTMHYFFVPNRLIWFGWEEWITNPTTSVGVPPYIEIASGTTHVKLADYLGIPTPISALTEQVNGLPFAAYQAIYNEYYRDQNLHAEIDYVLSDGNNSSDRYRILRNRCWEHDYFNSALPFAQKGSAVDIPLGTPILDPAWDPGSQTPTFRDSLGNAFTGNVETDASDFINIAPNPNEMAYDPDGSLIIDPTTINDLRRAFRLQEWLEKTARGGSRYIEQILSHFGVRSSDKRLQRPEYITGMKSPVVISEVLNSTGESGGLPQGNMAGHGVSVTSGKYGHYRCEEHGIIMGIMSVMPKPTYQQGIPKMYLKNDQFDYFWPSFAHIGEQAIQKRELYAYTGSTGDDLFGYTPRYAEYKQMPSRVCGDFRTTLDYWHLGRIFGSLPVLNDQFIECNPADVERIFAIQNGDDNLYCHVLNKIRAVRPMPRFGTPSF